jgi:hypothetical protein
MDESRKKNIQYLHLLSEQEIQDNFNQLEQLIDKFDEDRKIKVHKLFDEMGTRIATAPASSRKAYHAAYVGGLVDHTLRVIKSSLILRKNFDVFKSLSMESVIFAAMFHDMGKVGEAGPQGRDYYIPQDSDWHFDKLGEFFKTNPEISYMTNVDRTMQILLHYGINVSEDEYLAIRLNDGQYDETNKRYSMKEPPLALLIHMADRIVCETEKEVANKYN